jgi:hypothetical protein
MLTIEILPGDFVLFWVSKLDLMFVWLAFAE